MEEISSRWRTVLDKKEFREELDRVCRAEWISGLGQAVRFHLIKEHRNRCTFEIVVETPSGWRSLIAKVHAVDRSDVFEAMGRVVSAGFGPESEFAISRPLAYLSSLNVLLEEKVQGTTAMELFLKTGVAEQRTTAYRCGAWLARFHTIAPRVGKITEPLEQLRRLRNLADDIKRFEEPFSKKCESLLRKLEGAVPEAGTFEFLAGHGSYIPAHVLLSGERTVTINLDDHDVADPGRDLASFVASLQRLGLKHIGSIGAYDRPVEEFLEAYAAHGPQDALSHLAFYKAADLMDRARRDLCKWNPPFRARAEASLDEGLRML